MIVVRIMGGLGNQLFQYAAGRRLAMMNNDQLKLDISDYDASPRPYRLDKFNITAETASGSEAERLAGRRRTLTARILARLGGYIPRIHPANNASMISERSSGVHQEVLSLRGDAYLNGYWQSELYFKDIEDVIRTEFTLKDPPDALNLEIGSAISACESVSLHVRRGDYVSNPQYNAVHGTCPLDYYRSAIKLLAEGGAIKDPHIFVFSDDLDWVKDNLKLDYPTAYMDHNGEDKDHEDLRLMSLCKHHIVANSSFSWWGAWLCDNPDKTVIAPRTWFNDRTKDSADMVPGSWWRI